MKVAPRAGSWPQTTMKLVHGAGKLSRFQEQNPGILEALGWIEVGFEGKLLRVTESEIDDVETSALRLWAYRR